ncbi:hypothetical protein HanRHA438_Chr02g0084501 [Helianthus annuus]|nr:hypothetical protein HanIR_Chr02g0085531 [Helianthus annuus]KAJ0619260.1 hypothetical protein HanHA89_Chr02g0069371 [Helianthus annuus]KAJ0940535.1 hypothetical protein HanRHA438_Chr02g0084501 [Helianthus annuus]
MMYSELNKQLSQFQQVPILDSERVKLPTGISVRSNGYLKMVGASDGGSGRVQAAQAVDLVKLSSDMKKVYVHGKKEEKPEEFIHEEEIFCS